MENLKFKEANSVEKPIENNSVEINESEKQ